MFSFIVYLNNKKVFGHYVSYLYVMDFRRLKDGYVSLLYALDMYDIYMLWIYM